MSKEIMIVLLMGILMFIVTYSTFSSPEILLLGDRVLVALLVALISSAILLVILNLWCHQWTFWSFLLLVALVVLIALVHIQLKVRMKNMMLDFADLMVRSFSGIQNLGNAGDTNDLVNRVWEQIKTYRS